jgi:hypothetical protein
MEIHPNSRLGAGSSKVRMFVGHFGISLLLKKKYLKIHL